MPGGPAHTTAAAIATARRITASAVASGPLPVPAHAAGGAVCMVANPAGCAGCGAAPAEAQCVSMQSLRQHVAGNAGGSVCQCPQPSKWVDSAQQTSAFGPANDGPALSLAPHCAIMQRLCLHVQHGQALLRCVCAASDF